MFDKDKQELESKIFEAAKSAIAEYETKTGNRIDEINLEFFDESERGEEPDWVLGNVDAVVARS